LFEESVGVHGGLLFVAVGVLGVFVLSGGEDIFAACDDVFFECANGFFVEGLAGDIQDFLSDNVSGGSYLDVGRRGVEDPHDLIEEGL
jgi:hypothetical protein